MKLRHLFEADEIEYTSLYTEEGEIDYQRGEEAEALVKAQGLNMLRDDEITDVALDAGKVVGVMFSAVHGQEMNTSIAVDPKYRGQHIATTLFDSLYIEDHIERHVAELVPPYTLESFLTRRGYTFVTQDRDIKIYEKRYGR